MQTTVYTGCSYTAGTGWPQGADQADLWVNILHHSNAWLCSTELINLGKGGASNQEIFLNSVQALLQYQPRHALVQWTSYPRYRVLLGFETYDTDQTFISNGTMHDHNLHKVTYPQQYLSGIRDRFLSLHHPHADIINIVKYTNALINLSKLTHTTIFFINGLCDWDYDYFDSVHKVPPSQFTPYTQQLLHTQTRDDSEAYVLYAKLHKEYQLCGGIQQAHWLNLYQSMRSHRQDVNLDQIHPGSQSNILYSKQFDQSINAALSR